MQWPKEKRTYKFEYTKGVNQKPQIEEEQTIAWPKEQTIAWSKEQTITWPKEQTIAWPKEQTIAWPKGQTMVHKTLHRNIDKHEPH